MSTQWGSSIKPTTLTHDEAVEHGYTVERGPRGLIGFKGPVYAPTAVVKVTESTKEEAK